MKNKTVDTKLSAYVQAYLDFPELKNSVDDEFGSRFEKDGQPYRLSVAKDENFIEVYPIRNARATVRYSWR